MIDKTALWIVIIGLAVGSWRPKDRTRSQMISLLGTFLILPAMLALPFLEAVPDTRFINAYVEMVSSLTTTGATLFDPDRLPMSIHIWRAVVAWLGGLLMWITAFAVLLDPHSDEIVGDNIDVLARTVVCATEGLASSASSPAFQPEGFQSHLLRLQLSYLQAGI